MSNTAKRFVAFIDILGFRNLVENKSHAEVYNKINIIVDSLYSTENIFKNQDKQWIKAWVFSDSIMLVTIDDSEYSADVIMLLAAKVVSEAVKQELLVKGAIAYGEFTANYEKSIFFGKPLIQSYELEEDLKVASIIFHNSFEKKLNEIKYKGINLLKHGRCFKYITPMKFGNVNHLHLNWLYYELSLPESKDREEIVYEEYKTLIENIYLVVSGQPRIYIDNTVALLLRCKEEYHN